MKEKIEIDETCIRRVARWLHLLREHELDHLEHAKRHGSWDLESQYAGRSRLLNQMIHFIESQSTIGKKKHEQ